tara:strand:- start:194 stop:322 length:129 start_codon:yes stop_codon:yes gene_type:complete
MKEIAADSFLEMPSFCVISPLNPSPISFERGNHRLNGSGHEK